MDNEMNDENIKEWLKSASPRLSTSFEEKLMMKIEQVPQKSVKTNSASIFSLLALLLGVIVSLGTILGYYRQLIFNRNFFTLIGSLGNTSFSQHFVGYSNFYMLGLVGLFFLYFFDLFLSDFFQLRKMNLIYK